MISVPWALLPVLYVLGFWTPFIVGYLLVRKAVKGR